jgi:tartrate dehydratase alpha subunit/fumarate hydratase class I-like protein
MTYSKELELTKHKDFILGQYIYMGMGKCNGITVCISVAYKIDYCIKKAQEFVTASNGNVVFYKINKIKIGELEKSDELLFKDL